MRGLGTLAWRMLKARPLRAGLTTVGVALGVAVLLASIATTSGLDAAIDRTVADVVGRADLRVSAFLEPGLSDEALATIRATDGVAAAAPAIERRTFLRPAPGATSPGGPVTVLGIDPETDALVHELTLAAGAALARPDERSALVTERLAAEDGYAVGDELTIQGAGEPTTLRIVGLVAGSGPFVGSAGRTVVVPLAVARETFAIEGVTRADLVFAPGATQADVLSALEARLTSEPFVVASPNDIATSLRASTLDIQTTTALIAVLALFVGSFLIFNTLSMTVGERAREVGLLRAAGATSGQVGRFVLSGAFILGSAGSALGVVLGLGLARLMAVYVGSLRTLPAEPLAPGPLAALAAFAVGLFVTLAAAMEPAVRAGRISPVESLRARLDLAPARRARLRWLVFVFVLIAAVGVAAWPAAAGTGGAVRSLAVNGALLVATLASPLFLPALGRIAGLPFAAFLRLEERLARGALARDRSRTALTLGALTVGLAMVVALGWSAAASKAAAAAWLSDVIPGDEVVTSIRPVGPDEGVAATLGAVPGVARVSAIATFDVAAGGLRLGAAAVSGADLAADGRLRFAAGDRSDALAALDAGGATILSRSIAERLGLDLGDALAVALADGSRAELEVVGIVERSIPGRAGEAILVGWEDAASRFGVRGADFFAVRFEPGAGDAARAELESVARTLALEPNPLSRVQGAVADALGRVFGLFDAIALVAVLIAGLGIVNTLTMSVSERVRELGLLRALGMTRRGASRMVVVEAGVLGLVGAALGVATGLGVGWLLLALGDAGAGGLELPWGSIAVAAVLGVATSLVAAWWPARLASRVSIVRALAYE